MGYIYTFDIGSILFLSLTIFFYVRQRRTHDLADRLYFAMLICGMVAVVFDFVAAAMEYSALRHPVWLLYAVNMLFITAMQACLPLFFIYVNVLTGRHYRSTVFQHVLFLLPYMATMALLLLSPFVSFGICYIDSGHIYRHGSTHIALYINTFLYVASSILLLFKSFHSIQRAKRNVLLLFVVLLFAAVALQLAFPRYLLTASATALSLTAMFYVLQSPVDRINPFTGAFSRMLLPTLLADYHGRKRPYTLVLFSLHSFDEIIRLYGSQLGDALLYELTRLLQTAFSNDTVFYMDTWEFTVLRDRILSESDVADMARRIPDIIDCNGMQVPIEMHLAAIPFDSAYDAASTLSTADFLLRRLRIAPTDGILYADADCRSNCAALLRLEASLDNILREGASSLRFSPVIRPDGSAVAEDVSIWIEHPAMLDVPYQQFLQAIGQGGYVFRYYRQFFALLSEHAARYSAAFPACVQLSAVACMQDDAADMLHNVVKNAGFPPQAITFFMHEADVAAALPVVHGNIRRLSAYGFGFRMDSFAAGLTDLSQLTSLPVSAVKLDPTLVQGARQGGRQLALLSGTLQILRDLGKIAICAGVETAADLKLAADAGATLVQQA